MIKVFHNLKSRYKFILDIGYNLLASFISIMVMQLLLYPVLAKILNSTEYGQLLTVMGILNTISSSIGNTLNNTRLIQNTKYIEKNLEGDFNILLSIMNTFGFVITIVIGNIFFEFNFATNLLLSLLVIIMSIKSYLLVEYRLKLDYRLNLISSIVLSVGYIIGIILVYSTSIWPLAFIIAELLNVIYLLYTTRLCQEAYKRTELFKETTYKYSLLIATGLLGNLLLYLDRLIIYPVLGGEAVSIYTTASLFGKSLGMIMTPIAGVLLSYFSQKTFIMTRAKFWNINIIVFIFSLIFFLISLLVAPMFTGFFYPTLIEGARSFIIYANVASIIAVTSNIIQPSVLKFAPTYWQVIKELIYGIIYFGLGYILLKNYGIFGFCWAAIIANSFRLIFLCIIGSVYLKNRVSKNRGNI